MSGAPLIRFEFRRSELDGHPSTPRRGPGLAYLRWACANPTHLGVISTPALFDLREAERLRQENQKLIAMTGQALREAAARDLLGHFPRWGVEGQAVNPAAVNALALFVNGLRKP